MSIVLWNIPIIGLLSIIGWLQYQSYVWKSKCKRLGSLVGLTDEAYTILVSATPLSKSITIYMGVACPYDSVNSPCNVVVIANAPNMLPSMGRGHNLVEAFTNCAAHVYQQHDVVDAQLERVNIIAKVI